MKSYAVIRKHDSQEYLTKRVGQEGVIGISLATDGVFIAYDAGTTFYPMWRVLKVWTEK